MADTELIRFLASWALVHEMADEGWKAAVERGKDPTLAGSDASGDVVDGISALIYREKERVKAELAAAAEGGGESGAPEAAAGTEAGPSADAFEELRFEVGEVRGRLESIQTALDAIVARLDATENR